MLTQKDFLLERLKIIETNCNQNKLLYLPKEEPTKASLWLFLCPIFGFLYSNILTGEPISLFTIIGTLLVIFGLYLGQRGGLKVGRG